MDTKAFYKLSYGLYIVTTTHEGFNCGCVVNTLEQVTSSPAKLAVAINKDNCTAKTLLKSKKFAAVALTESADMKLIGEFGFKASDKVNKFANFDIKTDINSIPYVIDNVAARFSCNVVDTVDLGSHIMFIGEVIDAEVMSDEDVMTYSYYHKVKKGTTPPKAPSFNKAAILSKAEDKKEEKSKDGSKYQCRICGYTTDSEPQEDYECPICGQGKDKFEKI